MNPTIIPDPTITDISFVVDRDRTVEQMVRAGACDYAYPNVTTANFPVEGEGKQIVNRVLVHFGRTRSDNEIDAEFKRLGLRDVKIEDLLGLGKANPHLHLKFSPIIIRGSDWRCPGESRPVACLFMCGLVRCLFPRRIGSNWHGGCRFLARRKKPEEA